MSTYVLKTLWRRRICTARTTLELRRVVRQHIGRRRSARMRYQKIGANSYLVLSPSGRVVMEVYRDAC